MNPMRVNVARESKGFNRPDGLAAVGRRQGLHCDEYAGRNGLAAVFGRSLVDAYAGSLAARAVVERACRRKRQTP